MGQIIVTGNVRAEEVLEGKKFSAGLIYDGAGKMLNRSLSVLGGGYAHSISVKPDGGGNLVFEPPTGYYTSGLNVNGYGSLLANDPDFIASNIRSDKNIFGLQGTMPYRSGVIQASGTSQWGDGQLAVYLPEGYYGTLGTSEARVSLSQLQAAEPKLVSKNIKSGEVLFGLTGTAKTISSAYTGTVFTHTSAPGYLSYRPETSAYSCTSYDASVVYYLGMQGGGAARVYRYTPINGITEITGMSHQSTTAICTNSDGDYFFAYCMYNGVPVIYLRRNSSGGTTSWNVPEWVETNYGSAGIACTADGRFVFTHNCQRTKIYRLDVVTSTWTIISNTFPNLYLGTIKCSGDGRYVYDSQYTAPGTIYVTDTQNGNTRTVFYQAPAGYTLVDYDVAKDNQNAAITIEDSNYTKFYYSYVGGIATEYYQTRTTIRMSKISANGQRWLGCDRFRASNGTVTPTNVPFVIGLSNDLSTFIDVLWNNSTNYVDGLRTNIIA